MAHNVNFQAGRTAWPIAHKRARYSSSSRQPGKRRACSALVGVAQWLAHALSAVRRQCDDHPVELLREDDLAAEPAGRREARRLIEHVLLLLDRLVQQVIMLRRDYHMAGRACKAGLAGTLERQLCAGRMLVAQSMAQVEQVVTHLTGHVVTPRVAVDDDESHDVFRRSRVLHLEIAVQNWR